jgi:uncharacterized protein
VSIRGLKSFAGAAPPISTMNYFYYRLNAPRKTFAQDMTPEEAQLMGVHAAYWKGLVDQGKVIVVGPVLDPKESFGVGIVQLPEGEDPQQIGIHDPAITANKGFTFEVHVMPRVMVPAK